jgi:hypothetical protein
VIAGLELGDRRGHGEAALGVVGPRFVTNWLTAPRAAAP